MFAAKVATGDESSGGKKMFVCVSFRNPKKLLSSLSRAGSLSLSESLSLNSFFCVIPAAADCCYLTYLYNVETWK